MSNKQATRPNQCPNLCPCKRSRSRKLLLVALFLFLVLGFIGRAGASEPTIHLYEDCTVRTTAGNPAFARMLNAIPDDERIHRCDTLAYRWS